MKTSKPFSTISYNSINFLKCQLDDLVQRNVLYFYAFVPHLKEEDETKNHIHLLMHPNGQIETDRILRYLEEFDSLHPDKPLRCLTPHKSNSFGDWYLYGLHDTKYLLAHGHQSRKHHYVREDFIVSNDDEFNELIHTIDYKKMYGNQVFWQALEDGMPLIEMLQRNIIPMQQYGSYSRFFYDYTQGNLNQTFRGSFVGHDNLNEIDEKNDYFIESEKEI